MNLVKKKRHSPETQVLPQTQMTLAQYTSTSTTRNFPPRDWGISFLCPMRSIKYWAFFWFETMFDPKQFAFSLPGETWDNMEKMALLPLPGLLWKLNPLMCLYASFNLKAPCACLPQRLHPQQTWFNVMPHPDLTSSLSHVPTTREPQVKGGNCPWHREFREELFSGKHNSASLLPQKHWCFLVILRICSMLAAVKSGEMTWEGLGGTCIAWVKP